MNVRQARSRGNSVVVIDMNGKTERPPRDVGNEPLIAGPAAARQEGRDAQLVLMRDRPELARYINERLSLLRPR